MTSNKLSQQKLLVKRVAERAIENGLKKLCLIDQVTNIMAA